jgi:spore coat polysaccharide biosynthesis protein SpsF (cytidylyltransferase family)
VAVIVQARMGSHRFPGKGLADVAGRPMIARVVARARRIDDSAQVIVATTTDAGDDPLAGVAEAAGATVFRGHPLDVLDRFQRAATQAQADVIVRVTGDCPVLDPAVGRQVLDALRREGVVYASNVHPPTFPDGLDVEAFTAEALATAWREATDASDREHVTPFLWRQPDRFVATLVRHEPDLSAHRWTVDEPVDLAFVSAMLETFSPDVRDRVTMGELLALLADRPDLRALSPQLSRNATYRAPEARSHES